MKINQISHHLLVCFSFPMLTIALWRLRLILFWILSALSKVLCEFCTKCFHVTEKATLLMCVCVLSHVWLCDLMDCRLPGFSVHGIFQARILEWVIISLSRWSSRPRDWTRISCTTCTGRRVLYHCATWEAHCTSYGSLQSEPISKISCVRDLGTWQVNLPKNHSHRAVWYGSQSGKQERFSLITDLHVRTHLAF